MLEEKEEVEQFEVPVLERNNNRIPQAILKEYLNLSGLSDDNDYPPRYIQLDVTDVDPYQEHKFLMEVAKLKKKYRRQEIVEIKMEITDFKDKEDFLDELDALKAKYAVQPESDVEVCDEKLWENDSFR